MKTTYHILESCPVTHDARVKRRNEIVEKIAGHHRKTNWGVEVEPRVKHDDGHSTIQI